MVKKDSLRLPEEERKKIYSFRQLKKKRAEEEATKSEREKEVDALMEKMVPSYKEWENAVFEAGESAWFAMSELDRFKEHCDTVHKDGKACQEEGCLEDFTMEDAKEYMQTIVKHLEEHLAETKEE